VRGNAGPDLCSIPVDSLFATHDEVKWAVLFNGAGKRKGGGPGICAGKFPVTDEETLVRPHGN